MSANRWLARAEEIRRATPAPAVLEASPEADEADIERAAIVAEGCGVASGSFVQFAPVQESAEGAQKAPPEAASRASGSISGQVQIGQLGQNHSLADTAAISDTVSRLGWPAGGWQALHATLLDFWSAPRRDTFGTITRYPPAQAARLAFSHTCDHWRRRHLPDEKDGTRARVEAAKALGAFGVTPPAGWEP